MKLARLQPCIFIIFLTILGGCGGESTFERDGRALVSRLMPGLEAHVVIEELSTAEGRDRYEIEKQGDKLVLRGSSLVAVASALNGYLRQSRAGHLSWGGDRKLATFNPASVIAEYKESPFKLFYALNFTAHGYSTPYWDWPEWEREIDLMAAHGITHVLVVPGVEYAYSAAFQKFGYSDAEARDWLTLPAHLPWQLMGNMHSEGPAVSSALLGKRLELGRKIVGRMRELGMTPVLPGYYGLIPDDFEERLIKTGRCTSCRESGAVVTIPQGKWAGDYPRPLMLNPNSEIFAEVAAAYYDGLFEAFGPVEYFAADLFHEGGRSGGIDVVKASRNVQNAMLKATKDAQWVVMAWQSNPTPELLTALDRDHLLVIDLYAEERPAWVTRAGEDPLFGGAAWVWSIIQNFGGNTGLTGNLAEMADLFGSQGAYVAPNKGNLAGLGMTTEALGQNPIILDFMFDLRWRDPDDGAIDLVAWSADYAERRYGIEDPALSSAWQKMVAHIYRDDSPNYRAGGIESIIAARPSLDAVNATTWGPKYGPYYPHDIVEQALEEFLSKAEKLKDIPTYHYDLVDITRQALANRARVILSRLKEAYAQQDAVVFEREKQAFLQLIEDQQAILATHRDFSVVSWIDMAKSFADNDQDRAAFEQDARMILTTWSPWESNLMDYAHREWAGLVAGYYYPRWQVYLDYLSARLAGTEAAPPELWAIEKVWVDDRSPMEAPSHSPETAIERAHQIYTSYFSALAPELDR